MDVDKKFAYMLTVDDMDVDEKFASIFLLLLRPLQLSKLSMILSCGQHTFQIKAAAFNCCPHFKKDLFLSEPKNIQRSVRALNQKEVSKKGFGHRNGAMSECRTTECQTTTECRTTTQCRMSRMPNPWLG
jgi:hypothetical protein